MPRDTGGSSSTHGSTGRQGASSSTSDASTRGWRLGADSPPGPTDRAYWLTTPYYDRQGNLIGVQNRNLDYSKSADVPRFRFPRGARCSIYNLPVVNRLKAGDELFITEGCSDCWAMLSSGRKAIAIPSATLLSHEDMETLRSLSREKSVSFHMFPDCDAPGESLFMQLRDVLPGLVHHQLPVGCKDFGEAYSLEELRELRS